MLQVFEVRCSYTYDASAKEQENCPSWFAAARREFSDDRLFVVEGEMPVHQRTVQAVKDAARYFRAMLPHWIEVYSQPEESARKNIQLGCLQVAWFHLWPIGEDGTMHGGHTPAFFEWKSDRPAGLDEYIADFERRAQPPERSMSAAWLFPERT